MPTVDEVYEKILPTLEALDFKRRKLSRRNENIFFFTIGVSLLIIAVAFTLADYKFSEMSPGVPFLLIIIAAFSWGIRLQKTDDLLKSFKIQVVPDIIEALMPTVSYEPFTHIGKSHFNNSLLFRYVSYYSGEDYFKGTVDGINFELSEIKATVSSPDSENSAVNVFQGLFLLIGVQDKSLQHTIVVPNHIGGGRKPRLPNQEVNDKLNRFGISNQDFEKYFDAYTTDYNEARELLNEKVISMMVELREYFKEDVYFSFKDAHIYVFIRKRSSTFLEPDLKKSITTKYIIHKFIRDIQKILDVVSNLNSGTEIWKKLRK